MYNLEWFLSGDIDDIEFAYQIINRCKVIIRYILDEKMSIRQCAAESCISKSTVHRYIHSYICMYYDEEYVQIKRILKYNQKHPEKFRKR